ncbi:MAG: hypothetical protein D3917_14195, partial [Candidatus Electrothrix sp. AX5]|nr:hypothetical protein [Candidatus Electrothrix sp. AX5]
MKVSLFVPLVSLPFFAACSPALHNTDPLKNINQEEVTARSFSAEKNSEEIAGVTLKKVSAPPRLAERTIIESTTAGRIAAKIAANN